MEKIKKLKEKMDKEEMIWKKHPFKQEIDQICYDFKKAGTEIEKDNL